MIFTFWALTVGLLLIVMALSSSLLKRLPLTSALLYLAIGFLLARYAPNLLQIDLFAQTALLEHITEAAVLVSLFTAGLKLRTPFSNERWQLPVRLASLAMLLTVGMLAAVGVFLLGLPLGAAILLGAVLAPTDPVLASDVQVEHAGDRDRLRFTLTGEAGLNDGSAFPLVMLGLGLLGLHDLGTAGWRWLAIDVLWATIGGLAVGWLLGLLVGRLVIYLRREHREAVGYDEFLSLGLIALAYGAALLLHSYGFLAVFAAGLALRRVEHGATGGQHIGDAYEIAKHVGAEAAATDPTTAPAYLAESMLSINEQLERIGEVVVVVLIGGMLATVRVPLVALWFVPLLFLIIRPLAVTLSLLGSRTSPLQRGLMAWFGIRGIGSVYYLMYAISHGLVPAQAILLAQLTLITIATSAVVHGISVTPLMHYYSQRRERRRAARDRQPMADG